MRKIIASAFVAAFTTALISGPVAAATGPAKSKMGCIIGKEKWNALDGKCAVAKPVAKAKPAAKPVAKPAAKKAA